MNILFDFLTVWIKTGAGEYQRRVFFEMLSELESRNRDDIKIYALYDSGKGIAYEDLTPQKVFNSYIEFVDCHNKGIDKIVLEKKIDRFFIASAHYLRDNPEVADIKCEVIWVNHDFYGEELYHNKLYLYLFMTHPEGEIPLGITSFPILYRIPLLKNILSHLDRFSYRYIRYKGNAQYAKYLEHIKPGIQILKNNKNTKIVTVSEYSKVSLNYYFDIPLEKIDVLYSPEKICVKKKPAHDIDLKILLESKRKYYVLVSAGLPQKNPFKTLCAFKKYAEHHPDSYLVTLGYKKKEFQNHICLSFLDDSDLALLYENCYALIYPSFFEGFGYPPIEVMHYGKPVLCSNSTSMPSIYGDAPIYFCPFYESAIYNALLSLTDSNYLKYSKKAIDCYQQIHKRQEEDLKRLIEMILK